MGFYKSWENWSWYHYYYYYIIIINIIIITWLLLEIVIMYAPDEAAMNQVLIKNMKTGEQTIINNDDLQNEITKLIKK